MFILIVYKIFFIRKKLNLRIVWILNKFCYTYFIVLDRLIIHDVHGRLVKTEKIHINQRLTKNLR